MRRFHILFFTIGVAMSLAVGFAITPMPVVSQDTGKIKELRTQAEAGDAEAQSHLGLAYLRGYYGVPKDYSEAMRWYRLAANQGHVAAKQKLAKAQKIEEVRVLAEEGDAEAQHILGEVYYYGKFDVPHNHGEAVRWFRLAAKQGYADSQNSLGFAYTKGHGVPRDKVTAYVWHSLAGRKYFMDELAKEMTPDQIAEAQKRSAEIFARISGKAE